MAEAFEAGKAYEAELETLTVNSKPIINSLTMIAEDHLPFCTTIVDVIEQKIQSVSSDRKLPVIYLLDSICKNIGGAYVHQFTRNLPAVMGGAYSASSPKVKGSLHTLVKTWDKIFPQQVLQRTTAQMTRIPAVPSGLPGIKSAAAPKLARAPPPPPSTRSYNVGPIATPSNLSSPTDSRKRPREGGRGTGGKEFGRVTPPRGAQPAGRATSARFSPPPPEIENGCGGDGGDNNLVAGAGAGGSAPAGTDTVGGAVDPATILGDADERQELETMVQRVSSHLQSSLPPDEQLMRDLKRALDVYRALLNKAQPNTPQHDLLNRLYKDLQMKQAQQSQIMTAQARKAARLKAAAAAPSPPPKPATALGEVALVAVTAAVAPPAVPAPPATPRAVALPKVPAPLASPLAPSREVPMPLAPARSVAPQAPAPVDVMQLFKSLHDKGFIKPLAAPPPPPRSKPPPVLCIPDTVHLLYFARALQCKECGQRFDSNQQADFARHLEWHRERSLRNTAKGAAPPSRRWMLRYDEWLTFVPSEEGEQERPLASAFDATPTVADLQTFDPPTGTDEPRRPTVLRAPSDMSRVVCAESGEEIELFFDPVAEEWMLKDAIRLADGRICLAVCAPSGT
tara:strand:+ start:148 stop:2022 length:1875 start_codon:yes stop_codon:yes gene_type:complete